MRKPRIPTAALLAAAVALGAAPAAHASAAPAAKPAQATAHSAPAAPRKFSVPPNDAVGALTHLSGTTHPAETSPHWSGYAVAGNNGTLTSVTSNWVQPRINYAVPGDAATWVGLDGFANGTVEQIGTDALSINGQPYYTAWYEMYPFNSVPINHPVGPGDNMTASVNYANGAYTLYLRDLTQGWSYSTIQYGNYANASAEVVLEASVGPSGQYPITQYGYTDFYGNSVNGQPINSTNLNTWAITLNDANGGGISTPSATDAQGNFAVTNGPTNSFGGHPRIAHNTPVTNFSDVQLTTPSATGGTANTTYMGQGDDSDPVVTSLPGGGFETAFEATTAPGPRLVLAGTSLTFNAQLGMALGTHPAIASQPDGTWEVAFQADTGQLYKFTPQTGGVPLGYYMAGHTNPSITAMPDGSYEIAIQGSDGNLWEINDRTGGSSTGLQMAGNTSPAIAAVTSGGTVVAFQDRAGYYCDMNLIFGVCPNTRPMASGTSPGITGLAGGGYEAVFQANTGLLWEVGTYYNFNTQLGMKSGTSPAITAAPDTVFEVAFQANTGVLWLQDLARGGRSQGISEQGNPSISY